MVPAQAAVFPWCLSARRDQVFQAGRGASRAERTALASISARYGFGRNVVPGIGSAGGLPLERMTLAAGSIFRIARRTSIPDRWGIVRSSTTRSIAFRFDLK